MVCGTDFDQQPGHAGDVPVCDKASEDFNYHLIRKPRVIFQPSKELQRAVASAMFYELDGVVEGGLGFADIASYRNWQAGKLNANTKDKEI